MAKRQGRRYAEMADASEAASGKPRKRQTGKAATRPAVSKVKATLHLSVEASQRLTIHAAMMNLDRSELVEWLIQQHLRRYVVSDRGEKEGSVADEAA